MRFLLLVVLNVVTVLTIESLGPTGLIQSVRSSVGISLACLSPVCGLCWLLGLPRPSPTPFRLLVLAGALVWAGSIEFLLRRFADRPKDAEAAGTPGNLV